MSSGRGRVGGLHLSAPLLQQTAELQANKLHYHRCHQQQIPLQQITAVHITSLTARKHPPQPPALARVRVASETQLMEYNDSKLLINDSNLKRNSSYSGVILISFQTREAGDA